MTDEQGISDLKGSIDSLQASLVGVSRDVGRLVAENTHIPGIMSTLALVQERLLHLGNMQQETDMDLQTIKTQTLALEREVAASCVLCERLWKAVVISGGAVVTALVGLVLYLIKLHFQLPAL
jgi:hypothetical protein